MDQVHTGRLQLELRLGVGERIGPLAKMLCKTAARAGKVLDRAQGSRSPRDGAQSNGLRVS